MHPADLAVLVLYIAGVVALGTWVGGSQRTVQDYFIGGRRLPAWAIMGSIVATETSTVTFISIPGFAYGADFTFLQLVLGFVLGRIVVSMVLVPAYFRGEVLTAYQLLGERFGLATKRLASLVFLATRSLADGFRLFATGLVLAALLSMTAAAAGGPLAGASDTTVLVAAVLLISAVTLVYSYRGGMTAVVWTDVAQLLVYLVGAIAAAVILLDRIPGGWSEVASLARGAGKFRMFDFSLDVTRSYTFWSGVIGGFFLTAATHGTDQMLVQRYLCARSERDARLALVWSGVVVFVQFTLFLAIGTLLWVYYTQHAPADAAAFTVDGVVATDRIFPSFIVNHLPPGLVGLVLAAVLAAAMSTLSSSLNSSSAAVVGDFILPAGTAPADDASLLLLSRRLVVGFGIVQAGAALAAIRLSQRVVDEVLAISAFTSGLILGLFILGTFTRRVRQRGALSGLVAGTAVMLGVKLGTAVSWQWYVLIGAAVTTAAGLLADRRPGAEPRS